MATEIFESIKGKLLSVTATHPHPPKKAKNIKGGKTRSKAESEQSAERI